ncbi:tetratricopeptide repeat protein [Aquisphaera insulae]|uniref:tetratricopeptide repeat protein n=1 Tax=Aquisphaera insulae TaxID=2712864 RepID=UPI0013E9A556|nr:tetratricopeptide repeat protein [Aquisphaera insulae]
MAAGRLDFRWFLAAALLAFPAWIGLRAVDLRQSRASLADAQADLEQGRYSLAARKLSDLVAGRPSTDEAWYLLGVCEAARGRNDAAERAWARVAPESSFAPRGIQGRMQLAAEAGRLAEAEAVVQQALADPRIDGASLPILLSPLFCQQGRLEETLRLLEARWQALDDKGEGASEAAINLARVHPELRLTPVPRQATQAAIEHAAGLAPDDDRVWLGRANLALLEGKPDDARRWLEACLKRRSDDPPVWRSWLAWAMEFGQAADVDRALEHLPAEGATTADVRRIVAWRAARLHDAAAEKEALERLIAVAPADRPALDRLADLATREGDSAGAERMRRRKAEVDAKERRYRLLLARVQPLRDAAEMTGLALDLGEWFEARAFLRIVEAVDGDRAVARAVRERLRAAPVSPGPSRGTLAAAVEAARSETGEEPR